MSVDRPTQPLYKPRPRVLLRIVVLMAVVLVIVGLENKGQISNALTAATTHKPETFTELYFVDYPNITKTLEVGKTYRANFEVKNQEARTITYVYEIQTYENGKADPPIIKSLKLANQQGAILPFSYSAHAKGETLEITVLLVGQNQRIHLRASS